MQTNPQPESNPLFYFDYQELTPEESPLLPDDGQTDFESIAEWMKPMTAGGVNSLTISEEENESSQKAEEAWSFAMDLPEEAATPLNVWREMPTAQLPFVAETQQGFVQEFQPEPALLAEVPDGEFELLLDMGQRKDEPQLVAEGLAEAEPVAELIDTDLFATMINTHPSEENLIDIKEEEKPRQQVGAAVLSAKSPNILLRKRNYVIWVEVSESEQALLLEDKVRPQTEAADKTTQLIENFLDKEPKISSLKQGEDAGNWVDIGENLHSQSEIITESMAKIMLLQGNREEAINIYEKLSLLFPEKSAYFAAHIQNIISNK